MSIQSWKNVTLYRTTEFIGNVVKIECRSVTLEVKPYAQYMDALFVTYLPKGKRTPRKFVLTYRPRLWILEGFRHPEPAGMFGAPVIENGLEVSRSSYASFDDRWESDFRELLAASSAMVVYDAAHAFFDRFQQEKAS